MFKAKKLLRVEENVVSISDEYISKFETIPEDMPIELIIETLIELEGDRVTKNPLDPKAALAAVLVMYTHWKVSERYIPFSVFEFECSSVLDSEKFNIIVDKHLA
ncbi:hypothetical protein NH514_04480 [Pseudoalteromonas sp. ACER1]|uniref:hypothetical protein n=1 Tax=unclassified Pseudoalteromonas TaxID=194690 RepID=UPI001F1B3E46|nr:MULTISPECIES: hypothetical protein [unclassified Pseudoalteromonas]MCF2846402.1 hypothetical protein [Pseudoalteromonas sp. PAST1]MCO7209994.1 hypothetical protein [Pseudoalteromonas sp. ACER1]